MRSAETLRGRGSFRLLFRTGRKFDGEVLRCFLLWQTGAGTPVRAGFSVSAKMFNAVKRNRARRLMRASYRQEQPALAAAAKNAGTDLTLLFVYRGTTGGGPGAHPEPATVRSDMSAMCRNICAALSPAPGKETL